MPPHMSENQVVGSMTTFPARFDIIAPVIDSIAPQLDHLYIYVNETTEGFPDLSYHHNVTILDGRQYAGDLSANGKIYPLNFMKNCQVLTLDDDFIFPRDYVTRNLAILEMFRGRCAVTTHGGILPPKVKWYYDRTHVMVSKSAVSSLQLCSLAGSGTFAFDQRYLKVDPSNYLNKVMVDLSLSLLARDAMLPIWVLPREAGWLESIPLPGLWEEYKDLGITHHTYFAREIDWSFSVYADIANKAIARTKLSHEELGIGWELSQSLQSGKVPTIWIEGPISFQKRKDYLEVFASRIDKATDHATGAN